MSPILVLSDMYVVVCVELITGGLSLTSWIVTNTVVVAVSGIGVPLSTAETIISYLSGLKSLSRFASFDIVITPVLKKNIEY